MVHLDNEILFNASNNELSRHEKIWRNIKYILLSERSRSEKATYYLIPTTWYFGNGKNHGDNKKWLQELWVDEQAEHGGMLG